MNGRLLTEAEAAERAQVSVKTIRRLIEKGQLPAANYGTGRRCLYRIDPAALATVQLVEPPPSRMRRGKPRRAAVKRGNVWPPPNGKGESCSTVVIA